MPHVRVKGVANPMQFPDDMDISDIREFLRRRFPGEMMNSKPDLTPVESYAQAYEPSLVDRIGSGIADKLQSTGLISDNFRAQQTGKKLASIGEFLPGIGDAAAGDEFGRAVAEGDKLGMGMAALGAIPLAGDAAKKFRNEFHSIPLYHGTSGDIDAFDLSRGGETSKSPVGKLGVSVTMDEDLAKEYAEMASNGDGSGRVIELVHRAENPAAIQLDGTETNFEMAATIEDAWDNGYDAIMLKNYTSPSGQKGKSVIIVKDPSQLRKPIAAFDPKEKFNPSLLAGAAGLGILYGADQQDDDGQ